MAKTVSVIIVSYNAKELIGPCLNALFFQDYGQIEIVFVVNGSKDDSFEYVKNNYPNVKLLSLSQNIGFGPAVNKGIKKSCGDYILAYNDDVICEKRSISKLVEKMEADNTLGACQGVLIKEKTGKVESAGSFFTSTGVLYRDTKQSKFPHEIFSANLPLIRKSVLEKIGLFDNDYFLYFEEADLGWRIWSSGYRIELVPGSIFYHKGSFTTQKLPHDLVVFETFKNRLNSLVKNLDKPYLFPVLSLHLLIILSGVLLFLIKLDLKNSFAIIRAVFWNIKNLGKTLKKREKIMRDKKVKDREIFKKVKSRVSLGYFFSKGFEYFVQW